ncbi:MAG: hypothetical protein NZ873_00605 [Crenarchaeota archaeon]|nr:hypothetical protein [Thermoproteota archaeon]MDW8033543.1 hypothetical protein [Nitrososphaerota archaeon]
MSKEKPQEESSPLTLQVKNIGYYAGLTFGSGYSLVFLGIIFIFVEMVLRMLQMGVLSDYLSNMPLWIIVTLFFIFIGLFFGVGFGSTINGIAKSAKEGLLTLEKISSSVSAFSLMLLFLWLGSTVSAFVNKQPPFSPVCGVAGSALLLIGLGRYRERTSRFVGAIIILISIVLIYFVSYWNILYRPVNGLLFSELTIEVSSIIILGLCAVMFSLPIVQEDLKQAVLGSVLSVVGIVFSAGVIYLNFSALSAFSILTPISRIPYIGNLPGCSLLLNNILAFHEEAYSALLIFTGFLLLGISGIISIVTACLTLVISVRQLAVGPKEAVSQIPPPPPPPA